MFLIDYRQVYYAKMNEKNNKSGWPSGLRRQI